MWLLVQSMHAAICEIVGQKIVGLSTILLWPRQNICPEAIHLKDEIIICDNYILIYFPDAARANVDAKRIKLDGDEVDELAISVRYNQ